MSVVTSKGFFKGFFDLPKENRWRMEREVLVPVLTSEGFFKVFFQLTRGGKKISAMSLWIKIMSTALHTDGY